MRLRRLPDAASFLAAAGSYVDVHEAVCNLPVAIARHCVADRTRYPGPNWFGVVEDAGAVCGVALMTPPFRVMIYAPPEAAALVAADLAGGDWAVPGVHGLGAAAEAFVAAWGPSRGLRKGASRGLRIFELDHVIPAPPTGGAMRLATLDDMPFVARAYKAFHEETGHTISDLPAEEIGQRAVTDGRLVLWDDGGPVAQAAMSGSTARGARVGAVWTPPDQRRRGYATALVGALSQHLLDHGRRFCFLFTDLANPVSNSIYPKVGYRPVADVREFDFENA